jgi:alcohol dehydrogenase
VTPELLPEKLPERAFSLVVDATGSAEGLRAAISMCEPRGTVVMKSTVHGLVAIDTAPAIVNEITLVGSRCGRFEPAMKMLASGKVRVADLIAEEFSLDRAPEAFARAATKGVLKVLLRPPQ